VPKSESEVVAVEVVEAKRLPKVAVVPVPLPAMEAEAKMCRSEQETA